MRIFRRAEFLKLPAGTMYCQGAEWNFWALCVKGETIAYSDWLETELNWVDGQNSEECFERLDQMLKEGASFPVQNSECRDGMFNQDSLFLVWERADLEYLATLAANAIKLTPPSAGVKTCPHGKVEVYCEICDLEARVKLRDAIALGVMAERERCAKIAMALWTGYDDDGINIAKKIRSGE